MNDSFISSTYRHLKLNAVMSDWVTPDCAARVVRAMDVSIPPETHSEHIARSKQAGVAQSDSKLKCPFVLTLFYFSFCLFLISTSLKVKYNSCNGSRIAENHYNTQESAFENP